MLIGAVFAVGLLLLVYAVVAGMNYPISGVEETRNLLLQAKRAPGTSVEPMCFERSIIKFTKGEEFTDVVIGEDVSLKSVIGSVKCQTTTRCTVINDIELPVSAECSRSTGHCTVWFGQPCS